MTNHSQQGVYWSWFGQNSDLLTMAAAMETVGLSIRTGIIGSVFRKSLRLSARARLEHTVGQTTTIISTDSVRLDRFAMFGHKCVYFHFIGIYQLTDSSQYLGLSDSGS
jgi:hypothetical protein